MTRGLGPRVLVEEEIDLEDIDLGSVEKSKEKYRLVAHETAILIYL